VAIRQEPHAVDGHDNNRAAQEGNGALMQDDIDIISVGAPTLASLSVSDAIADTTGGTGASPSPCLASPINGAAKPRSGYARIRQRHHKLIAEHEQLKADFAALRQMYREMEEALFENAELLERLQSQRPTQQPPQFRPEPTIGLQSLFARGVR
jgi:hypothetical protein